MSRMEKLKTEQLDLEFVSRIFAEAEKGIKFLEQYGTVLPSWDELNPDWNTQFPDQGNGVVNAYEPNLPSSQEVKTRMWYLINVAEDWQEYTIKDGDLKVTLVTRDSENPDKPGQVLATPGGFKKPGKAPGESGIAEYGEEGVKFAPGHKQYVVQGLKNKRPIPVYIGYGIGDPGNRSDKLAVTTAFADFVPWEIASQSELREIDEPEELEEKTSVKEATRVSLRAILEMGPDKFFSPHHYYMVMIGAAEILKQLGYQA